MDNKLLDMVAKPFNVEIPQGDSMDDKLAKVLKAIKPHSEDLREQKFFIKKSWIEISDDETAHQVVLHVFNEESEYLHIVDGQVEGGEWRLINNKIMFGASGVEGIAYDLAFLDEEFFILQRHGNHKNFERRFRMFVKEPLNAKMVWHEALDYLFDKYRNDNSIIILVAVLFLLFILFTLLLS